MNRPTIIDLNYIELNYYPSMNSLDKCNGDCNAVEESSTKINVASKLERIWMINYQLT